MVEKLLLILELCFEIRALIRLFKKYMISRFGFLGVFLPSAYESQDRTEIRIEDLPYGRQAC
jgi:hypothetical protein